MPNLTGLLSGFMDAQNFMQQQQASQINIQRGQMENKALAQQQASTDAQSNFLADSLREQAAQNLKQKQQQGAQQAQQQDPNFQMTQMLQQYTSAATKAAQNGDSTSAAALASKANGIQELLQKRQQVAATLQRTQQATQLERQKAEQERVKSGADAFAPLVEGEVPMNQAHYEIALRQAYGNDLPAGFTGDLNADRPAIEELVKSSAGFREFQRDQRAAQHQAGKGAEHEQKVTRDQEHFNVQQIDKIDSAAEKKRVPVAKQMTQVQNIRSLVQELTGANAPTAARTGVHGLPLAGGPPADNLAAYGKLRQAFGNLLNEGRNNAHNTEEANKIGSYIQRTEDFLSKAVAGKPTDETIKGIAKLADDIQRDVVQPQQDQITLDAMDEARRRDVPEYMVGGAGISPTTAVRIDPHDVASFNEAKKRGVRYVITPNGDKYKVQ